MIPASETVGATGGLAMTRLGGATNLEEPSSAEAVPPDVERLERDAVPSGFVNPIQNRKNMKPAVMETRLGVPAATSMSRLPGEREDRTNIATARCPSLREARREKTRGENDDDGAAK